MHGQPADDRYEKFVQLLIEHEPSARAYLRGLLPGWNDVDEVVQEASLVAWRKFADFEDGTSFGGWFLTIARFEALKYRRKIARSPLVFAPDVWELLEQEAASEESKQIRMAHLESCLKQLSEQQQRLMLQAHSPGVQIRALAKKLGRSEQACYKSLQRLRKVLLECVSKSLAAETM